MKSYSKEKSLRSMLLSNTLALAFPLVGVYNGHLQPGHLWTYMSLGLQILPLFNILRLLMRITLHVRSRPFPLVSAWALSLASLGSALWWIPRHAGIILQ